MLDLTKRALNRENYFCRTRKHFYRKYTYENELNGKHTLNTNTMMNLISAEEIYSLKLPKIVTDLQNRCSGLKNDN